MAQKARVAPDFNSVKFDDPGEIAEPSIAEKHSRFIMTGAFVSALSAWVPLLISGYDLLKDPELPHRPAITAETVQDHERKPGGIAEKTKTIFAAVDTATGTVAPLPPEWAALRRRRDMLHARVASDNNHDAPAPDNA